MLASRHRFECIHSPIDCSGGPYMLAWEENEVIHIGAEAAVSSGLFLGLPAVRKVRRPRAYRNPKLDQRLTKHRMATEARFLSRLSEYDIPTPKILSFEQSNGVIIQTLMPGIQLVEILRTEGSDNREILTNCGEIIRKLHSLGGVHGDLTTNNIIWDENNGVSLIDFGLSMWTTEIEKLGLDLQVFSECLSASHPEVENALEWVFDGYVGAKDFEFSGSDSPPPPAKDVIERYHLIRSRVRYH